jgi:hypothetical protein
MILEKLRARPRIGLISTGDLAADLLQDANREVVFNQDRFRLPFQVIHFAIEMQQWICASTASGPWMDHLRHLYCSGSEVTNWRSIETGMYVYPHYRNSRKPTKRMLLGDFKDLRYPDIDLYRQRMHTMLASRSWKDSCLIFYDIPSPGVFLDVSRDLTSEIRRPFVFPKVDTEKQYYVYDGSHMEVDTALRWTAEFLPALEPYLDECLSESNTRRYRESPTANWSR